MGILNGEIVISTEKRVDAVKHVLQSSVSEDTLIVTIFSGKGVSEDEVNELVEYTNELNSDVEVQVVDGKQEIYSYIVAVE
jgi:dihydroxyacetone kinase-like predicted kinase